MFAMRLQDHRDIRKWFEMNNIADAVSDYEWPYCLQSSLPVVIDFEARQLYICTFYCTLLLVVRNSIYWTWE